MTESANGRFDLSLIRLGIFPGMVLQVRDDGNPIERAALVCSNTSGHWSVKHLIRLSWFCDRPIRAVSTKLWLHHTSAEGLRYVASANTNAFSRSSFTVLVGLGSFCLERQIQSRHFEPVHMSCRRAMSETLRPRKVSSFPVVAWEEVPLVWEEVHQTTVYWSKHSSRITQSYTRPSSHFVDYPR